MRFYTVLASRPVYYDRAPTAKNSVYRAAAVAPAASTVRWSYTVPANRKTFVEETQTHMLRATVATTAGDSSAEVDYTPSGGSASVILFSEQIQNVVGVAADEVVSSVGFLAAGDAIQSATADGSTGGTYNFVVSAKYTEFDA